MVVPCDGRYYQYLLVVTIETVDAYRYLSLLAGSTRYPVIAAPLRYISLFPATPLRYLGSPMVICRYRSAIHLLLEWSVNILSYRYISLHFVTYCFCFSVNILSQRC